MEKTKAQIAAKDKTLIKQYSKEANDAYNKNPLYAEGFADGYNAATLECNDTSKIIVENKDIRKGLNMHNEKLNPSSWSDGVDYDLWTFVDGMKYMAKLANIELDINSQSLFNYPKEKH